MIDGDASSCLLVAERDGRVVGWIHGHTQSRLQSPSYVEIGGLIVGAGSRRSGAGRALVADLERWAASRGLGRLRVRSNISRGDAHHFYPRVGYELIKTQHNYEKKLTR